MWLDSDGETFGHQRITDNELSFETNWIGFKHSFVTEIKLHPIAQKLPGVKYTFVYYFFLPNNEDTMYPEFDNNGKPKSFMGKIDGIGNYRIRFESDDPITAQASFQVPSEFNLVGVSQVVQGIADIDSNGNIFLSELKVRW